MLDFGQHIHFACYKLRDCRDPYDRCHLVRIQAHEVSVNDNQLLIRIDCIHNNLVDRWTAGDTRQRSAR